MPRRHNLFLLLPFWIVVCLFAGTSQSGFAYLRPAEPQTQAAPAAAAPSNPSAESVLAAAVSPALPATANGIVYVRETQFELEGVPLTGGSYQPLTTTYELWVDGRQPARFRQTIADAPGGLRYAKVSDGATVWEYGLSDREQAIRRAITTEETQAAASVSSFKCCFLPSVVRWALKQGVEAQARYQGAEALPPWAQVETVVVPWDGVAASTDRYQGRPHTIVIKTVVENHWVVAWQDVVHAAEGDVLHRSYRLEAMDVLAPDAVPSDLFAFSPPPGVTVVSPTDAPPEPTPSAATITLAGHTVPKFAFTPWLPTYVPEGFRMKQVRASYGSYFVWYEDKVSQRSLHINQMPNLYYHWGAAPEIETLPGATVEVGNGGPNAPSWLIARVHLTDKPGAPDFIVESHMGWDEMKQVILSLQPVK